MQRQHVNLQHPFRACYNALSTLEAVSCAPPTRGPCLGRQPLGLGRTQALSGQGVLYYFGQSGETEANSGKK